MSSVEELKRKAGGYSAKWASVVRRSKKLRHLFEYEFSEFGNGCAYRAYHTISTYMLANDYHLTGTEIRQIVEEERERRGDAR